MALGLTPHATAQAPAAVDGDLAFDVGYYALTAIEPGVSEDVPPTVAYGKFVTVLKRQLAGSWRIHVDGFSPALATYEAR